MKLLQDANIREQDDIPEQPYLDEDNTDNDAVNWQHIDGEWFRKVYTDGSALRPECRETARAGWGVFYGSASKRNAARKVVGCTQNSYRAEVRAALHAVMGAKEPTIVILTAKQ